jgi:hypothetical protein
MGPPSRANFYREGLKLFLVTNYWSKFMTKIDIIKYEQDCTSIMGTVMEVEKGEIVSL